MGAGRLGAVADKSREQGAGRLEAVAYKSREQGAVAQKIRKHRARELIYNPASDTFFFKNNNNEPHRASTDFISTRTFKRKEVKEFFFSFW